MHRHSLEDAVLDHHAALPAARLHSVHGRLLALSAPAGTLSAWLPPATKRVRHLPLALSHYPPSTISAHYPLAEHHVSMGTPH